MSSASPEVELVVGGAELLDGLGPLYAALVAHHGAVAPHLGATHAPAEAWSRRRAQYERWLDDSDGFLVRAGDDGYAFMRGGDPGATWPSLRRVAVVETLVVAPARRGSRLGERLLQAAWDHAGVDEVHLSVVATNLDAKRFYARLGFTPFVDTLRIGQRPG